MDASNGIIFAIILGVASANIKTVVVKEGDSLFLPCYGTVGNKCIWTQIIADGSGDVIAESNSISAPSTYHLTDLPESGDCSLNITDIKPKDSAQLICNIIPNPPVIKYRVFIGVEPKAPEIEYNNKKFSDGDLVIIETPAEINCVVEGGSPGAIVIWENENNDAVNVTRVSHGSLTDVTNTLNINDFLNETKPEKRVTCVVHHPLYLKSNQPTITVTVGEKYETMKVDIIENKTHASCVADGIPEPNILWQFKEENSDEWKNVSTSKTISLDKNGDYRCQAGNAFNGNLMVPSTNNVTVSGNANSVTPMDGTTSSTTETNTSTDEKNPSTDEANTLTDEANTLTDEANTLTDEANTLTDEANTLTDEANTSTDEAKTLTDEANTSTDETNISTDESQTSTDETNTLTDEANTSTDETNISTDEANTSTDETNISTDESKTSTDEANTSVDKTTPSINKASNKSSFCTSAIYIITALNLMIQVSKLTVI